MTPEYWEQGSDASEPIHPAIALMTWEYVLRPKKGEALRFEAAQFVWLNVSHGPFSLHVPANLAPIMGIGGIDDFQQHWSTF